MLVQLKYKNDVIPGYFISDEGKIYDAEGIEQELKFYPSELYYYFKGHKVHQMMVHSFYGYKKRFDVHHKNQIKIDNRLQNLVYLTPSEHRRLHMTGNKNSLGKKLSEEHKAKIGAAHKGKKHSEQSKAKMSAGNKGRKRSEQTKEKMSAAHIGKKLSDEHKSKLSAAHQKKQVYCVELDKVFEGIRIAAIELSLAYSSISQCCNGKQKTAGGYHFQFV